MEFCRRYGFIMAAYLIAILIIGQSDGRELRPSEHGLAYQNSTTKTTGKKSPKMMSFFGGSVSSASNVPFPEAKNMSDSWWSDYGGGRRGEGRDHVRQVLVVASLVCGITGVGLLVVAAFLFYFRYQKQRPSISSSLPSTSADK